MAIFIVFFITNIKVGNRIHRFFVSFRKCFSDKTRLRIIFFCRAKREFFFQNLTLGYMTKTLNQIFFSSTKIRIFFSATLGNRIFFLEKNHNPFKLNGRSLMVLLNCIYFCHLHRYYHLNVARIW